MKKLSGNFVCYEISIWLLVHKIPMTLFFRWAVLASAGGISRLNLGRLKRAPRNSKTEGDEGSSVDLGFTF